MSDPREALVALLWEKFGAWPNGPLAAWLTKADCARFADAILAAGWIPPGERVKPTLEQVVDALAAQRPGSAEWTSNRLMQAARAVLALFPGRTETEVKAEALREAADWLADMDDGRDTAQHRAGRDIIARTRDRAARLSRGEGS